jgi:hypothetical protein
VLALLRDDYLRRYLPELAGGLGGGVGRGAPVPVGAGVLQVLPYHRVLPSLRVPVQDHRPHDQPLRPHAHPRTPPLTQSLLLYLATLVDPLTNWINAIGATNESYLSKYLYSLYFCATTILTIGYGDITPKNKLEIVIVIITQFFGVIIFGYFINEIGHTLSIIRTNDENLQKDLTTLRKI